MVDLEYIRRHPDDVKAVVRARGLNVPIDALLKLDHEAQTIRQTLEAAQAERNRASSEMADLSPGEREKRRANLREKKQQIELLKQHADDVSSRLDELLLSVPNITLPDVPRDPNPEHNVVLREVGKKPRFSFPPRDYLSIAEELDIIDMSRAAKVSGSRFGYLKGVAAELEFALIQFTLTELRKRRFTPVVPPVMIRDKVIRGVGYLEAGGTLERYRLEKDRLYLVGSSEQSIVPLHADEVLSADELPKRYLGFSTCFRREAGAYGKDTKGILRSHQFDKLELISFCHPEQGEQEFQELLATEELLMTSLGLPYRVVRLVSGDTSFPLARTYDIETWMPGQGVYRETHSCSTATDFQARRLNIRFQRGSERGYVYTLNATAVAIGRTLIALIENYQTERGFRVPPVLVPYLGIDALERPAK